ncbi:unnamed protein product [Adineta steineri]|nr:unnamed protein product [Adineta steineri]
MTGSSTGHDGSYFAKWLSCLISEEDRLSVDYGRLTLCRNSKTYSVVKEQINQTCSHLCDSLGCVLKDHLRVESMEMNISRRDCEGIILSIIPAITTSPPHIKKATPCEHGLVDDGLLMEGKFLCNSRPFSYAKLPPNTIRTNIHLLERLSFYKISIDEYEQAYEHFHIPLQHKLASRGVQLLKENLDFIPYYHRYHQMEVVDEIEKMKLDGKNTQIGFRYFISVPNKQIINNDNQTMTYLVEEETNTSNSPTVEISILGAAVGTTPSIPSVVNPISPNIVLHDLDDDADFLNKLLKQSNILQKLKRMLDEEQEVENCSKRSKYIS